MRYNLGDTTWVNHDCCKPIIIYMHEWYHFHAHCCTFWFKIGKTWKDDFIILNEQINLASVTIKILHFKLKFTLQIENWFTKLGQLHSNFLII